MLILPAIDLRNGTCVRLRQGDFDQQTTYSGDPLSVARSFEEAGASWIHIVDLDGARDGSRSQHAIALRIATETRLKVELGGGIRTIELAKEVLDKGIARVVMGSALLQSREFAEHVFRELQGSVAAGLDARGNELAVHGWEKGSSLDLYETAKEFAGFGCQTIICTDISRDGMMEGPNLEQLGQLSKDVPCQVIASGGVSTLADVENLQKAGVAGMIIGRALYEDAFDLKEALALAKSP